MRDSSAYNRVFCEADLKVWPIIVHILKYADKNISQMRPTARNSEGFLKKWRYIISFLTIAYIYKDYNYTISQLISLDLNKLNGELFNLVWNYIKSKIPSDGQNKKYLRNNDVYELLSFAAADFDIQNLKSISGRKFITNLNKNKILSEDFLEKVDSLLPEQPWKPGIHNEVIKKLKCTKSEYFSATQVLIDRGRRYMQKDGIVYFNNGEIKCIDTDRVDAKTLQLKI